MEQNEIQEVLQTLVAKVDKTCETNYEAIRNYTRKNTLAHEYAYNDLMTDIRLIKDYINSHS